MTSCEDHLASVVFVHGGAGYHPPPSDPSLKRALKLACASGLERLEYGSAVDAVESAVAVLENEEDLNAGYGSNLTTDGIAECDASIMESRSGAFGAVGAVSGVRNPIKLAKAVLDYSQDPDPLGRISPLTLAGAGATAFARAHDIDTVKPEAMISPRARRDWQKWNTRLNAASADPARALPAASGPRTDGLHAVQDTVGAVALDTRGGLAAGVSSGGLLLKLSGRVGEAAVFGAGCWAALSGDTDAGTYGILGAACSVSGAGELIVRAALARAVVEALMAACSSTHSAGGARTCTFAVVAADAEFDSASSASADSDEATDDGPDTHAVLQCTLERFVRDAPPGVDANVGLILLVRERGAPVPRLWCAFTSAAMAVAYASVAGKKPKALVLRKPAADREERDGARRSVYITTLSLE